MKKKRKLAIIFLFVMVVTFLTGCKGDEISKDTVVWKYQKQIAAVELETKSEPNVYVSFDVILLNKDKEIIYKESFSSRLINDDETLKVNLEDIKPDYISYDKVDSMEVEIINVYDFSGTKFIALMFVFAISVIGYTLSLIR